MRSIRRCGTVRPATAGECLSARRWLARGADDTGVIAVITALLAVLLFVFAAIAVDVGRWYSEGQRVQRAVDAAALAGAPFLPGDLASARVEARKLLAQNGYDASLAAVPDSDITIGDRPSRLQVRLSSTIPNAFGTVVGARFKTVTRTAVADFAATVTMGSPCNVLGNDPDTIAAPTCPNANFWNSIAGPDTFKVRGDRYATRRCEGGESNCGGTRNLDYSGGAGIIGQSYYVYRIRATGNVSSMRVQAFDPMFVHVGNHCEVPNKLAKTATGLWELGAPAGVTDAAERYAWGDQSTTPQTAGTFCTGDNLYPPALPQDASPDAVAAAEAQEAAQLNTTFLALNPTNTLNPMRATPACQPKSFGGFSGDLTKALVVGSGGYVPEVAGSFRRWVDLCTISAPQRDRDYYLLVRTNVPGGADASRMLNPAEDPSTRGNAINRFGLRVSDIVGGDSEDVSISAVERLPMYANLSALAPKFHLARVTSANAGGVLTVSFYDIGDASAAARIEITDPGGNAPENCTADGEVVTSPTGSFNTSTCTLSNVHVPYQGKIQRIKVPIPSDYVCDDSAEDACWYRLTISYQLPGAIVNDATTWAASLDGDPVRLVK